MKTNLKDIKGKSLKIGDKIAWCSWNYDLNNFGKTGNEYQFSIGETYFEKGRVITTNDEIPELWETDFLIIEQSGIKISVENDWDWNYGECKPDPELEEALNNLFKCISIGNDGSCYIRIAE